MIAACLRIEEKTVRIFARELLRAGMLTTGGRGLSAPDMTNKDLAVMLIALLATDKPSRAVDMVRYFGAMQLPVNTAWLSAGDLPESPDHSFLELMNVICDPGVAVPDRIFIEVSGQSGVTVRNDDLDDDEGSHSFFYRDRQEWARLKETGESDLLDQRRLVVSRCVSTLVINSIKTTIFDQVLEPDREEE